MFASRLNHSCVPNSRQSFIGDMLLLRATKAISKGEEVLISYTPDHHPTADDFQRWGIVCACALCVEKDKSLINAKDVPSISSFVDETSNSMKSHVIEEALRKWESTYQPKDNPSRVPRTELAHHWIALMHQYASEQKVELAYRAALKALDLLGFILTGKGSMMEVLEVKNWGFCVKELVEVWVILKMCYLKKGRGYEGKARKCEEFGRRTYGMVCGEEETFGGLFDGSMELWEKSGRLWGGLAMEKERRYEVLES